MTRALCMIVVTATLVAAVAVSANAETDESIVVTRNSGSLPGGCTVAEVADLARRLFLAFNAADWEQVDEIFAPAGQAPPNFALFTLEREVVIYDREQLVPHLAEVRSRGERLRLVALRAVSGHRSMVGIQLALEREGGIAGGKGMVDCVSRRIWQGAVGSPAPGAPPVPCPRPPGWSLSGPILACTGGPNTRAVSADFELKPSSGRLPRQCSPPVAFGKLRSALSGFNGGNGEAFARHFAPLAIFHPYTRTSSRFTGRTRITRFASTRYDNGDGWTATALHAPARVARPASRLVAVYLAELLLTGPERAPAASSAEVSFDCRSGLIQRWIGPVAEAPPTFAAGQL